MSRLRHYVESRLEFSKDLAPEHTGPFEEMLKELGELERLAEIGKAVERAFEKGFFVYDVVESHEGDIIDYKSISDPDDFKDWATSQ